MGLKAWGFGMRSLFLVLFSCFGTVMAYQPHESFIDVRQNVSKAIRAQQSPLNATLSFPFIRTGDDLVRGVLASSKPTLLLRIDEGDASLKKAITFARDVAVQSGPLCNIALIGRTESVSLLQKLGITLKNPLCSFLFYQGGVIYELSGAVPPPVLVNFIKNQCRQKIS